MTKKKKKDEKRIFNECAECLHAWYSTYRATICSKCSQTDIVYNANIATR